MSDEKIDGGPAFPCEGKPTHIYSNGEIDRTFDGEKYFGMTLRDYFAGKAMQELIANKLASDVYTKTLSSFEIAQSAFDYADAMLQTREQA